MNFFFYIEQATTKLHIKLRQRIVLHSIMCHAQGTYSRVQISSDEVFSKILRKPSIVQKKMIPHMKAKVFFIGKKQKKKFEKKNSKWPT